MLTFNPEGHEYRYSGKRIPSVTQCLGCLHSFHFLSDEEWQAACDRGTYVHRLCEYDDLGELDVAAEQDGEHWPRLLAWRKFCKDYGANFSGIEETLYSKHYGYAGTPDRRGKLEAYSGDDLWVPDIKTSLQLYRKPCGAQTAAYRMLLAESIGPEWALARRAVVRLLPDGTYRFDELTDPMDWTAFASLLNLLTWNNRLT